MIHIDKDKAMLSGTAKEVTFEFTHLLLAFKRTMMKEFDLSESDVYDIIKICGELAFSETNELYELLNVLSGE